MVDRPVVILDLSAVAEWFDRPDLARGVHRVAYNLVTGLIASGCIEPRFVATSHLARAENFLRTNYPTLSNSLYYQRGQLSLSRWAADANRWIEETLHLRSLPRRAARFVTHYVASSSNNVSRHLSPAVLRGAQIYHSPLAPLPKMVMRAKKIQHFLTVHDLLPLTNPDSVGGEGVALLKQQVGALGPRSFAFCTSESVRSDLLQHSRLDPEHTFVAPLAADRQIFYPVTEPAAILDCQLRYGIPAAPYFLAVSSFDRRKNFGHVVQCFARLVEDKKIENANLVVVGANPHRNNFVAEAIAKNQALAKRIILPGFIPDADLARIYSGALAFVFPSLGEGFGIPVLEAMQCGVAVLSSNAAALPEVVGDAGLLLNPRNVDDWCAAMQTIYENDRLKNDLRVRALTRAAQFSWRMFIEKTLQGYRTALEAA